MTFLRMTTWKVLSRNLVGGRQVQSTLHARNIATLGLTMFAFSVCWLLKHRFTLESSSLVYHRRFFTGPAGGAPPAVYTWEELIPHINADTLNDNEDYTPESCFTFHSHGNIANATALLFNYPTLIAARIPVAMLCRKLTKAQLTAVGGLHGCHFDRRTHIDVQRQALACHSCEVCAHVVTLFRVTRRLRSEADIVERRNVINRARPNRVYHNSTAHSSKLASGFETPSTVLNTQSTSATAVNHVESGATEQQFPPIPPSREKKAAIIARFCCAFAAVAVEETGCAVCGHLILVAESIPLSSCKNIDLLASSADATRKTRVRAGDPISAIAGPVLASGCTSVCEDCHASLEASKIPLFSLTNYLWLGDVPAELQDLSYAEKILIARVRHNRCVVRVQAAAHKMAANAISFANPMPDVYDILPPPLAELDNVLAFVYTGPCQPQEKELRRTPLLVRRNKVKRALEWLKLNHESYADLNISRENLQEYPESGCPLVYIYRKTEDPQAAEALANNDDGLEDGTSTGQCSFTVHGLVGEDLETQPWDTLKSIAVRHLTGNNKILGIGHSEQPE